MARDSKTPTVKQPTLPELTTKFTYFPFLNQKIAAILIGIIGFVFYITSINGEYALDDGIIIHQNDHVLKGFRGIPAIMTKDAYESFYRRMCATDQLAGGRYRPLSVVSFAVEQQFLGAYRSGLYMQVRDLNQNNILDDKPVGHTSDCGRQETNYEFNDYVDKNNDGVVQPDECYSCWDLNKNFKNEFDEDLNVDGIFNEVDCQVYSAKVRHFNNIWTFALGCVFLYLVFAKCFFRKNPDLAFLAALLFTMHPIHSEAIANVKSRDEIFSLIFVSLTFLYSFKYIESKTWQDLLLASVMFLLALLSKEYAVMLLMLVPLAVYTFIDNGVAEDYIKTKLAFRVLLVLACGFVVAFVHKGLVNPLLGDDSKAVNRFLTLCIWIGLSYVVVSYYNKTKLMANLGVFKFTDDIKNVLIIAVGFIACAALMLVIKRNFDTKVPQPIRPSKDFWLLPIVYLLVVNIICSKSMRKTKFVNLMGWFGLVMLVYLGMRLVAVKLKPGVPDTEILNNPYLLANEQERFATKGYVLLKYFRLLVFPHPLSSDYSFKTIPYRNLGSWDFWVSMVFHIGMLAAGVYYTIKKHVIGFAIMTYILFALMIGNVLMDIGATMGERLIFHSSIGFCIGMAWFMLKGFDKLASIQLNLRRTALVSIVLVIGFLFGCKTWERNFDWKNDVTLFLKDVKTMPHSVLVLGNAGARWVDLADTKEITGINVPGQDSTRFNDYNGTLVVTDDEVKEGGYKNKREAALYKGIAFLKHAIELHPRYVNGYLNLGLAYFKLRKDFEALYYWKNAERLYPNNPYLRNYYQVYSNDLRNRGIMAFNKGHMDTAAIEYNKWTILEPNNPEAWYNLGGAYFNQRKYFEAKNAWERTLQLNPNHQQAKQNLPMANQVVGQIMQAMQQQTAPVSQPINLK